MVYGNGGSAADSQHIAGELVGKFLKERRALNVRALSVDTSVITAWANDVSYARFLQDRLRIMVGLAEYYGPSQQVKIRKVWL